MSEAEDTKDSFLAFGDGPALTFLDIGEVFGQRRKSGVPAANGRSSVLRIPVIASDGHAEHVPSNPGFGWGLPCRELNAKFEREATPLPADVDSMRLPECGALPPIARHRPDLEEADVRRDVTRCASAGSSGASSVVPRLPQLGQTGWDGMSENAGHNFPSGVAHLAPPDRGCGGEGLAQCCPPVATPQTERTLRLEDTVVRVAADLEIPALSSESSLSHSPGLNPQGAAFCSAGSQQHALYGCPNFAAQSLDTRDGSLGSLAGAQTDGRRCPFPQVQALALATTQHFFIGSPRRRPCELSDEMAQDGVIADSYEILDLFEPWTKGDAAEDEGDPSDCGATVQRLSPMPRARGAGVNQPAPRVKEEEGDEHDEEQLWGRIRTALVLLDAEPKMSTRVHVAKEQLQMALNQQRGPKKKPSEEEKSS